MKKETPDYHEMIKEIDELVQTDFCFYMNCKLIPNSKRYTQEESEKMANLLGRIYSISHKEHCKACMKYA